MSMRTYIKMIIITAGTDTLAAFQCGYLVAFKTHLPYLFHLLRKDKGLYSRLCMLLNVPMLVL